MYYQQLSPKSNLLNHFIFADFLLKEDYQQGTLQKESVTAPFIERFKTTSLRNSNWKISLVLTVICLLLHFCSSFLGKRLWTGYSTKGADHNCSFDKVVSNIFFGKVSLKNVTENLLTHFIFVDMLLIEDFEQCAHQWADQCSFREAISNDYFQNTLSNFISS